MCGRYALIPSEALAREYFDAVGYELVPNYNVAPTHTMPIMTSQGLEAAAWGLVPSWSKEFKPSFTTFNARAESVAEKPLFRTPYKKYRCLVPASGYYEWQTRGSIKQPYFFRVTGEDIFSLAGVYDMWYDSDKVAHKSYSIITTTPNEIAKTVHDRMPVILDDDEAEFWLDPSAEPDELQLMLKPYEEEMVSYEVDRAVGKVSNNYKELMGPLNSV